jgi:DNA-binding transcriptional LysR family regulator
VRALQQLQIDMGFAHWGHFPTEIEAQTWMSEAFLCCLPANHKLAKKRRIDLRQLAHEPFILFPRDVSPHYHDQIIATCVEAGFSPRIRHEARLWQTVVTMVEFQMGVALVPQALARTESQRAVFVPLAHNPFSSQILRLTRAGSQLDLAQSFLAALQPK